MFVNQYILVYENGTKTLKSVREIEYEKFNFPPDDDKELFIEQFVDYLKDILNKSFSLGYLAEEHLFVVAMDLQYNLLGIFEVSHGTEEKCSAGAKEIMTRLLMVGAERFVEFHNHPNGCIMLSDEDADSWQHLKNISESLGIDLLASAVVSEDLCNYFEDIGV